MFQASQSLLTLRHLRLTVSFPTVAPNKAVSATTHPPCMGAGEIAARNQRVGGKPYAAENHEAHAARAAIIIVVQLVAAQSLNPSCCVKSSTI
jgi:hypothetical protein